MMIVAVSMSFSVCQVRDCWILSVLTLLTHQHMPLRLLPLAVSLLDVLNDSCKVQTSPCCLPASLLRMDAFLHVGWMKPANIME